MKRVLLTGGCGFVGHRLAAALVDSGYHVTILDKLTYASVGFTRLRDIGLIDGPTPVRTFSHDFVHPLPAYLEHELGVVDIILHLGGETHVDRSIEDAEPFVLSNVLGTLRMLDLARRKKVERFLYFSTDEIFGPALPGQDFKEDDRYRSGNPYAATKAAGEELAMAYHNTHGVPVIVTHTMNIFGERQLYEKFIPQTIRQVLNGEIVTIHADKSRTISGSRFYLHAEDLCDAVLFLLREGKSGEKYNIVGEREVTNIEVARSIADRLQLPLKHEMLDFHSSRPGHDLRYGLCGNKLNAMGWRHKVGFDKGLAQTVQWYTKNPSWLYPHATLRAA